MPAPQNSLLPEEADLVVIGSGAGGLTAALTAALAGLEVVVLEHLKVIGGTSARSSGTVWVPDNPYMRAEGVTGDREAAERYLASLDRAVAPNPCLGPIATPPFYALAVWPTPLGTSRGLAADVNARVLDASGAPIPGLYACGNDMQSAFGGEYLGAGAQLGQAKTFGWIAARHATGLAEEETAPPRGRTQPITT